MLLGLPCDSQVRCVKNDTLMGLFHVGGRLSGPTGRSEEVELLVDCGATFVVVPQSLAEKLELRATRTCPIQTAGGRDETWPLAEVRLAIEGDEVNTRCLISPAGPALLGAVALESLLLAVDPVGKRLIPVKGFVGQASVLREPFRTWSSSQVRCAECTVRPPCSVSTKSLMRSPVEILSQPVSSGGKRSAIANKRTNPCRSP